MEQQDIQPDQSKEQEKPLDSLKNNLPLISIGLLIIGTVNLVTYYKHFNVDILTYLDFTEVLQLQFVFYAICFAVTMIMSLSFLILYAIGPNDEDIKRMRKEHIERTTYEEREIIANKSKSKLNKTAWAKRLFLSLIVIAATLYFIKNLYAFNEIYSIILPILFGVILGPLLTSLYYFIVDLTSGFDSKGLQAKLTTLAIFMMFVFFTYTSGATAYITAIASLSGKSLNEVKIITEKDTITTNKYYRFVGKTKNFTFFYDMKTKQATIIKNDNITSTFIRNGIDYSQEGRQTK